MSSHFPFSALQTHLTKLGSFVANVLLFSYISYLCFSNPLSATPFNI
jgi:hypothetical protein